MAKMVNRGTRGFGLAGETPLPAILAAARAAEPAGYDTFWLSQPATGSTLATLQRVAEVTEAIRLGVGAIPLTSTSPEEIARTIETLGRPRARLRLGIGSGVGPGSLARLREGAQELRQRCDVEIVVAPLGPRMCALAGEVADTVLLNWLTPEYAVESRQWVRSGATAANRPEPLMATYVRCIVDPVAETRLRAECDRYGSFPHYAKHFARQGVSPIETTIRARSRDELQTQLARYDQVLDHVVVRAIAAHDTPADGILRLVEAAAPNA